MTTALKVPRNHQQREEKSFFEDLSQRGSWIYFKESENNLSLKFN